MCRHCEELNQYSSGGCRTCYEDQRDSVWECKKCWVLNDLRQIQCRSCPEDQQGSAQPLAQPTPYASTSSQRCLTPHGPPLHTPPAAIPQTMSHSAPSPTQLMPASLSTSSQLSMVPHLSLATPHGLSRPTMPFPPYLPTPWPQTPFATSPHLSQQFPYPCIPPPT